MEYVNPDRDDGAAREAERRKGRLNTLVAITVALLATFMGICKVKDDNVVQAMQMDQARSIDTWAWYQAKKTRLLSARQAVDQWELQALTATPATRQTIARRLTDYREQVAHEETGLKTTEAEARGYDTHYDRMNLHDDQFDLSDALLSLAIALLAVTSLTQKRWMYWVAMVPTLFGVFWGVVGLFSLPIHSSFFARLLGT